MAYCDNKTDFEESAEISPKTGKPKKKPRGGNSPVIGNNGLMLQKSDNTKIIGVNIQLFNMPSIDLNDVDAVAGRLTEYFNLYGENDLKPTVVGMAMALNGHSRQWLWALVHDKPLGGRGNETTLPRSVTDTIKKAYFVLENSWESYMNSYKIHPTAGVFLGVNNYGYRDIRQVDVVPTLPDKTDSDFSADEIRQRYITPERLSDNENV